MKKKSAGTKRRARDSLGRRTRRSLADRLHPRPQAPLEVVLVTMTPTVVDLADAEATGPLVVVVNRNRASQGASLRLHRNLGLLNSNWLASSFTTRATRSSRLRWASSDVQPPHRRSKSPGKRNSLFAHLEAQTAPEEGDSASQIGPGAHRDKSLPRDVPGEDASRRVLLVLTARGEVPDQQRLRDLKYGY